MIVYVLISSLIVAIIVSILLFVALKRTWARVNIYEQWILEFKGNVNDAYTQMKEIDKQGVFSSRVNQDGLFESDDQVGSIFKQLFNIIQDLDEKTQ